MAQPSAKDHPDRRIKELQQQLDTLKQTIVMQAEQLHEKEKFRVMVEGANSIIAKFDANFNFLYINPYAQSFFGFTEEELIGRNAVGTIIPFQASTGKNLRKMIADMLLNPDAFVDNENENVRKNGDRVFVAWRNKVLRDEQGNFSGLLCFGYDITALKRNEIELKSAKETAEFATVAKSEFLANMSHEIRTPMNGVIGMIEMLLETELNAEQRDFAESAIGSANSLLTLINDILDFSKIEAGKLDIETIDFDLRITLEDLSEVIAIKAEQKGLRFHLFIDNEVPVKVKGDPGRLRQILVNLSGNAVKFTEEGEVSIGVFLERDLEQSALIRFDVTDTGIGVSAEKTAKLFESFTQADTTISRKFGGTGLGLSISKRLAELMGGGIGLNSNEGEGSTFWFTVRIEKQQSVGSEGFNPETLRHQRVLVADSSAMSRKVFTEYLTSWGCQLSAVDSGQQALEKLTAAVKQGTPYDLLILEKRLPDIDAADLAESIYRHQTLEALVSIIVTAYGQRGDVNYLKKAGFSGFLTKPLRKQDLHDLLTIALSPDIRKKPRKARPFITRYTVEEYRQLQTGEPPSKSPAAKPPLETATPADTTGLHILLAEDNPMNQKVAMKMLEKMGFRVSLAGDGGEAVSRFQQGGIDIILMDMQMPVLSGIEATQQIRSLESGAERIPIIACTANVMKGDREKCLDAGMDGFVSKPINKKELQEVISQFAAR